MKTALLTLLIITLIIAGPLLIIWSLNTLFNIGIVYNGWTWLATLFLLSACGGTRLGTNK